VTNVQVHEAVIGWLSGLTGATFIKDRQGIARPAMPYGIVEVASWKDLTERPSDDQWDELETLNSAGLKDLKATPLIAIEWTFAVLIYGSEAQNLFRLIQAGIRLSQKQEPLLPYLVVHDLGPVGSVPELVDEVWEPRSHAALTVRGWNTDGFVIDSIQEYDFDYTREG